MFKHINLKNYLIMKKHYYLLALILTVVLNATVFHSCKKDDDDPETTIAIDKTQTALLDIGDDVTAAITIVCAEVKTFTYSKVVDNDNSDPVDVTTNLTKDGDTYTYSFSYTLVENDDLHTLGFEFEVIDKNDLSKTVSLLVQTNLSTRSTFVKYDWTITAEDHAVWGDLLSDADAAKIFRFYEDGTYEVDLSADYAAATHHFCYWVYKETPGNGDTLAIVRLIRKQLSGDTGVDEYYDFRVTSADETEVTMYWDLAVWGLFDIERTFTSKPKGAFQPYGTAAIAADVAAISVLDCSTVDSGLLTIDD